jgi:hypothetical protein
MKNRHGQLASAPIVNGVISGMSSSFLAGSLFQLVSVRQRPPAGESPPLLNRRQLTRAYASQHST